MLKEMFGDDSGDSGVYVGEFLAEGEYESDAEKILKGYKVYQKKYVYKSLIWKMLVVLLALTSSIMMIMTSKGDEVMPVFCLLLTVFVGCWFISQPISNAKKLKKGLDALGGAKYKAEIFTDKIKISSLDVPQNDEVNEQKEPQQEQSELSEADIALDGEKDEIPASVIHLDSPIVDLLDKDDIFILVVKKAYVFIIPKSAFSEEQQAKVREKLSVIMGVRFKLLGQ